MTKLRKRPYWVYSVAVFVVWAVLFVLVWRLDSSRTLKNVALIFYGYFVGWLTASIARKLYR